MPLPAFGSYFSLLFLFQSLYPVSGNLIPHAWSIAVEILVYFSIPLLINKFSRKDSITTIILSIYLSFTGLALVSMHGTPNGAMDVFSGLPAIARCFCSYILGAVGYILINKYKDRITRNHLEILLIASCTLALIALNQRGFDLIAIASFFMIIPLLSESNGLISQFLSLKLFVYLGNISYSIYLVHYPLCRALSFIPLWFYNKINILNPNYLTLTLSIIISIFTYHVIEVPFRNIIKNKF